MTYTNLLSIIKSPRGKNPIHLNDEEVKKVNEIKAVSMVINRLSQSPNVDGQEFPLTLEEWCSFKDEMNREKNLKDIGL